MPERRLVVLSQGSWQRSIVDRNALDRLHVSRAPDVFDHTRYIFFPVEEEARRDVDPTLTVHELSGRSLPGVLGRMTWLDRAWRLATGFRAILRLAREEGPEAVYATDPFLPGVLGWGLSVILDVPLVVAVVSDYRLSWDVGGVNPMPILPPGIAFAVQRRILGAADMVLVDREYYRDAAVRAGAPRDRVRIAPCYADPVFHEAEPDPDVWTTLEIPDERPVVYVGRLSPEKYSMDLLDAFTRIAECFEDRHLVVVGGEGPEREPFLDRARARGLARRVHLREGLDRLGVFSAMAGAGVVLAPHAGYTLLEAALAGAPIVAYDYEWHPEVVEDGVTGRLVEYRDPAAMADAALEILGDPELGERLGRAAREYCRREHRIDRTREAIARHFRELLGVK